jgi:hypothetical protein
MSDILETASEPISDYTKKLDIALFYTNGEEDRARQMVAGTLKDVYVVKGKFSSTSSFGVFIAFFNNQYLTLNSVYPVISDSFTLKDFKTRTPWIAFEKDISTFMSNNEHDDVLGRQLKNVITSSFGLQFSGELKKLMADKSEIEINRLFQQMVQDRMGFQSVNMVVDIEEVSSLDMELYSITSRKVTDYKERTEEKKEAEPDIEVDVEDDRDALKGKEVRLILRGNLILSPISGRDIGLLVVGDRLKVKITDTHQKAMSVLRAFNAIENEEVRPIIGRIVSIRHRADGGYTIFAIVAKGIYVKVEELEENIKVAIDTSYMDHEPEKASMTPAGIAAIAGLGVALLALISLLLYFFLK